MRVILAGESLLFRQGLSRVLSEQGIHVVAQTGTAAGLMPLVAAHGPDVVVLNLRMPPHVDEGWAAAVEIPRAQPRVGLLLLAQHVEMRLVMTLIGEGGGVGYLLKERVGDTDTLSSAITTVPVAVRWSIPTWSQRWCPAGASSALVQQHRVPSKGPIDQWVKVPSGQAARGAR